MLGKLVPVTFLTTYPSPCSVLVPCSVLAPCSFMFMEESLKAQAV